VEGLTCVCVVSNLGLYVDAYVSMPTHVANLLLDLLLCSTSSSQYVYIRHFVSKPAMLITLVLTSLDY